MTKKPMTVEEMEMAVDLLEEANRLLCLRYPEDDGLDEWRDELKQFLKSSSASKKQMTVEEMVERWDNVAPPHARYVLFCNNNGHFQRIGITQEELQNIRDYLDAVEECLNG